MKITEEARVLIASALENSTYDGIAILAEESSCCTALNLWLGNLEEGDEPVIIDGIPVMFDAESQARAENLTVAIEDGDLVVKEEGSACCG